MMKTHNNKGFTLVEVIMAVAALGIICAVLLRLFVVAGDTNKRAGGMQTAQLHAASVAEVFAGSNSVAEALDSLGLSVQGGVEGRYALHRDGIKIEIDIEEEDGGYPAKLYALDIRAMKDGRELAAVSTAKYDKGAQP